MTEASEAFQKHPKATRSIPFAFICMILIDFACVVLLSFVNHWRVFFFMQFVDGSKLKILNLGESYQAQLENTTDKNQPFS
jgi:hypothetical protein